MPHRQRAGTYLNVGHRVSDTVFFFENIYSTSQCHRCFSCALFKGEIYLGYGIYHVQTSVLCHISGVEIKQLKKNLQASLLQTNIVLKCL